MRKISLAVVLFAGLLVSCGNKKADKDVAVVTETEQVTIADESNAQNSLDWAGTYKGVLPAADTGGMDVTITLSPDSTFSKTYKYLDRKEKPVTETGKYKWSEDGNIITLEGTDTPSQYFVSEGKITQLDADGQPITGNIASAYILTKVAE